MFKFKTMLLPLAGLLTSGVAFAQSASEAAPARGGSMVQMLVMIGIAIAFFYFIVLRPERKRRRAMEERRNSMQKGDKVTAMGIIGTVASVRDDTVILKLFDGAQMEILKAAVTDVTRANSEKVKEVEVTAS